MGSKKRIRVKKRRAERSLYAGKNISVEELAAKWEKIADGIHDDASFHAAGEWLLDIAGECFLAGSFTKIAALEKLVNSTGSDKAAAVFHRISGVIIPELLKRLRGFPALGFEMEFSVPDENGNETRIVLSPPLPFLGERVPDSELTKHELIGLQQLGPGWHKVRSNDGKIHFVSEPEFDF